MDRLHRESIQLRERVAALGLPPRSAGTAQRVEALRRGLLSVQARMRTLVAQAEVAALPPEAASKMATLQLEAAWLWDRLRQVIREEVPADPD